MKIKLTIVYCFLSYFLSFSLGYGQDINLEFYHGYPGQSGLISGKSTIKSEQIHLDKGSKITLSVLNPDFLHYKYDFVSTEEEIEEEQNLPDLAELVDFLNLSSAIIGSNLSAKAKAMPSLSAKTWIAKYSSQLTDLKKWIDEANRIINIADIPRDLESVVNKKSNGGYMMARVQFSSSNLAKNFKPEDVDNWIKSVKTDFDYASGVPEEVITMEAFDNFYKTLKVKAIQIVQLFDNKKSTVYSETFTVDEKKLNIKLIVSVLDTTTLKMRLRDYCDKDQESIADLVVTPNFERPRLELVPLLVISGNSQYRNFSIENGLVGENIQSELNYGVGTSLNLNVANWGKRKEISSSVGLGYALVNDKLNNLFINTGFNFGKWVRIGLGYGWLRTPTSLNFGLSPGDSVIDVENVEDIINYSQVPSFFINVSLPGLNLIK